jgi:hypothetical protein
MIRVFIILLVVLFSCSTESNQTDYIEGNWAYMSYELDPLEPYTEIYFRDSNYIVYNNLIGEMHQKYSMRGDTLFRFHCVTKDCSNDSTVNWSRIGLLLTYYKNEMIWVTANDTTKFLKLAKDVPSYFDYNNETKILNRDRLKNEFNERAINFYIESGLYNSRKAYLDSLEAQKAQTITYNIDSIDTDFDEEVGGTHPNKRCYVKQ